MQQTHRCSNLEVLRHTPTQTAFQPQIGTARRIVRDEEITVRIADGIELHASGNLHVFATHVEGGDVAVQTMIEPLTLYADIQTPQVLGFESRTNARCCTKVEASCF